MKQKLLDLIEKWKDDKKEQEQFEGLSVEHGLPDTADFHRENIKCLDRCIDEVQNVIDWG